MIAISSEKYKQQVAKKKELKRINQEGITKALELRKLKIGLCLEYSPFPPEKTLEYTRDMFRCFENFYKGIR